MYNADPNLLDKFKNNIQTPANNNDPRPLVYIARNKTAITSQRYWEKQLITSTVGSRSSIAVRRPEGSLLGDMIFTAQVEDGDAIIRYAEPKAKLTDMEWTELTRIENVSELSIMFDGHMAEHDDTVEAYTVGELPYVFYVDVTNSLKYINLDDENISGTISDDATNIATVRGLYAESIGLDDGIWCFYTNTIGELWEARILNGVVAELTQITKKPSGVTSWEDVWAGFTFDYRIILQLKGNDGKVYTLPSKSRPSGFMRNENLSYNMRINERLMFQAGSQPPNLISAYNTAAAPLRVILRFDGEIFLFNSSTTSIWLSGNDGTKVYPIKVEKANAQEIVLTFGSNLVGLKHPQTLNDNKYHPCGFGSNEEVSAIVNGYSPILINVDFSSMGNDFIRYGMMISAPLSGEIVKSFDGKAYAPNETFGYITMNTSLTGTIIDMLFAKGYVGSETIAYNMAVKTALVGTLLNADFTPL